MMIRARFMANAEDPRPVNWPIAHPYWISGYAYRVTDNEEERAVIVAYADDEQYIHDNWPEAENIESEHVSEYVFTGRFQKPEWFDNEETNDLR